MNVDEVDDYPYLKPEVDAINRAIDNEMPVLGICLGSQLLAKALGATVVKNKEKEIGWYDVSPTKEGALDPLISNFIGTEKIFQWHGDTFKLPKGAVLLASSELCKNQAFRYGDNIYGFQFHLEVDESMIYRWLDTPVNVEELGKLDGKIDPEVIRKQTPKYIERLKILSDRTFTNFARLFGDLSKSQFLPSI